MTVLGEISRAIARNPKINRVIISAVEYEHLLIEMDDLQRIKPSPRPTYGPPFGDIDRCLWDELQALMKQRAIMIMGRPVEIRQPSHL
jgi:hypothetical protein